MSAHALKPGELIVDSRRAAAMADANRRLYFALQGVERVADLADDLHAVAAEAHAALAKEPEFDAIPRYVRVDESWADTLPPCVECGQDVPWEEALLMPCSQVEDGDVDRVGVIHANGCGERAA